nr:hypothetical protein [Tanacetum cinerariifolium]
MWCSRSGGDEGVVAMILMVWLLCRDGVCGYCGDESAEAAGEGDGRRRVAGVGVNGGGDEGGRWWMRDGDGLEVRREVVWLP